MSSTPEAAQTPETLKSAHIETSNEAACTASEADIDRLL
jgi:hypothetical protein